MKPVQCRYLYLLLSVKKTKRFLFNNILIVMSLAGSTSLDPSHTNQTMNLASANV